MKLITKFFRLGAALAIAPLALVTGCAAPAVVDTKTPAAIQQPPTPVAYAPSMPAAYRKAPSQEGSLWAEGGDLSELFINAKARRVGDIVTIKIVESSKASNKASTNTGRTSTMDVNLTSLFNLENNYFDSSVFSPFAPLQSSYENDFDGTGTTARSGDLNAFITARIVQILPNGNMIIEGNREVRVNHENQIITLTGVVRSRDISSENVILSTFIADARISYSGSGIVNDKQRPGWLVRLLDNIWPF